KRVRPTDRVRVTLQLLNTSDKAITFKLLSAVDLHLELYDTGGRIVDRRKDFPIHDGPYIAVELLPRQSTTLERSFAFDEFYDVPPGTYELRFMYNRVLMEGLLPGEDPWIPWGNHGVMLEVI